MFDIDAERVLVALGAPTPLGRVLFDRCEIAAWESTGLSWWTIGMYGLNIGVERVASAIGAGTWRAFVDAGFEPEMAVWWAATGIDPGEARRRADAGQGPHQVNGPYALPATADCDGPSRQERTEEQP